MALSFPSSPTTNQQSTQNGRTYQWDGYAWNLVANVAGHASTHGAAGADPVTIATSQITGLAAVATSGSAADLGSGTLPDARLSGNVITAATLSAQQHGSATSLDVMSRWFNQTPTTNTAGTVSWTFFSSPYSFTASQISYACGTAATGITLARFGLYTVDSAGAVTLVARTASDTSIFATLNTLYTRSFSTTGGYPSTYSLVAGTRYAIAFLVTGSTGGLITGTTVGNNQAMSFSPRLTANLTGQTDLPTSVASGGYSSQSTVAFWGRVS